MDNITKTLTDFGLSDKEAVIYREALKHEVTSPFALSRTTKIPRTSVYELIMSLSLKGLVELEKSDGLSKQQTKIRARNPSVLRQILWNQRNHLWQIESDIVNILPSLKGDFHSSQSSNSDFQYYPGIEGAKYVYFQAETDETDIPQIGWDYQTPMDAFGRLPINLDIGKSLEIKKKLTNKPRELVPDNPWSRHVFTYQCSRNPDYIKLVNFRVIKNPLFDFKVRLTVKGNFIKAINIENNEMWGMIIKSASIAKTFISFFELMWPLGVDVTTELVKSWGNNQFLKAEKNR